MRGSPGPCPANLCECVFTLPHLTVPPRVKQATEAWEDDSPLAAVYLETLRDIAAGEEPQVIGPELCAVPMCAEEYKYICRSWNGPTCEE